MPQFPSTLADFHVIGLITNCLRVAASAETEILQLVTIGFIYTDQTIAASVSLYNSLEPVSRIINFSMTELCF